MFKNRQQSQIGRQGQGRISQDSQRGRTRQVIEVAEHDDPCIGINRIDITHKLPNRVCLGQDPGRRFTRLKSDRMHRSKSDPAVARSAPWVFLRGRIGLDSYLQLHAQTLKISGLKIKVAFALLIKDSSRVVFFGDIYVGCAHTGSLGCCQVTLMGRNHHGL